jgi:hypothetical protein
VRGRDHARAPGNVLAFQAEMSETAPSLDRRECRRGFRLD